MSLRLPHLILTCLTLGLIACNQQATPTSTAMDTVPDASPAVVRVNDIAISEAELTDFLFLQQFAGNHHGGGPTTREAAIEQMIEEELLRQAAINQGLDKEPEIRRMLARMQTNLLVNAAIERHLDGKSFTDAELSEEYQRQLESWPGQEYRARHILVNTEAEALTLIEELAAGAVFADLASQHSKDNTAASGGELGWFQAGMMVPEFSAALASMKPGEFSQSPVRTPFGWHIILLEETRGLDVPSLEDVTDELRDILAERVLEEYVASLRESAKIEVLPAGAQ